MKVKTKINMQVNMMVNMSREMKKKVEKQLITFYQFLSHRFSFRTLSSVM